MHHHIWFATITTTTTPPVNLLYCLSLPMPTGVVRMREVDTDFDNDADVRVLLLVHDSKPPFLDGRFLFTKQRGG